MADDADQATQHEQRWLEAAIQAARGIPSASVTRSACTDCGAALAPHRLYYGICVPCQTLAEARARAWRR
jgi:RNA polymerase-binding transcription factor DksA